MAGQEENKELDNGGFFSWLMDSNTFAGYWAKLEDWVLRPFCQVPAWSRVIFKGARPTCSALCGMRFNLGWPACHARGAGASPVFV